MTYSSKLLLSQYLLTTYLMEEVIEKVFQNTSNPSEWFVKIQKSIFDLLENSTITNRDTLQRLYELYPNLASKGLHYFIRNEELHWKFSIKEIKDNVEKNYQRLKTQKISLLTSMKDEEVPNIHMLQDSQPTSINRTQLLEEIAKDSDTARKYIAYIEYRESQ